MEKEENLAENFKDVNELKKQDGFHAIQTRLSQDEDKTNDELNGKLKDEKSTSSTYQPSYSAATSVAAGIDDADDDYDSNKLVVVPDIRINQHKGEENVTNENKSLLRKMNSNNNNNEADNAANQNNSELPEDSILFDDMGTTGSLSEFVAFFLFFLGVIFCL